MHAQNPLKDLHESRIIDLTGRSGQITGRVCVLFHESGLRINFLSEDPGRELNKR